MANEETTEGTQRPDTFAPIALPKDRETLYEAPKSSGGVVAGVGAALATLSIIGLIAFAQRGTDVETARPTAAVAATAMPAPTVQQTRPSAVVAQAPVAEAHAAVAHEVPTVTTRVAVAKPKLVTTRLERLIPTARKTEAFDPTADIAPGLDLSVGIERAATTSHARKLIQQPSAAQKTQAFLGVEDHVRACIAGLDPSQHHTVSVVLQIEGETGSVRSAQAGGVTSPAVLSCIERVVHRAKFPIFTTETDTASHSYQF